MSNQYNFFDSIIGLKVPAFDEKINVGYDFEPKYLIHEIILVAHQIVFK